MASEWEDFERADLPIGPLRRVPAAFTEEEIEKIDTWGFEHRIRDRTAVLRYLVRHALVQKPKSIGENA